MIETIGDRKAVVITGASRGLGRTIALGLAADGFNVFAGVRKTADGEALREAGGERVIPVRLDVTDLAQVKAAAAEVVAATDDGGIAGLVNNAGIGVFGPVEQAAMSKVEDQFRVNVLGALAVTQAFLPALRKGKGRIVNVTSINGKVSFPFTGIYSSTKFALEAISDALRIELEGSGVSVSVVEPGLTNTDIRAGAMADWAARQEELPDEERQLYEEQFQKLTAIVKGLDATAAGHEYFSRDVLHALTAETPQIRYQTGPDWEQWVQMLALSDEDRDAALREMLQ